jgi:hypothetical protein
MGDASEFFPTLIPPHPAPPTKEFDVMRDTIIELRHKLEAAEKSGAWILCSERLPRHIEGRFVDVVIGGIVQNSPACLEVGDDDIERWYWIDEDADPAPLHVVSHWRERPKFAAAPPSQEEKS